MCIQSRKNVVFSECDFLLTEEKDAKRREAVRRKTAQYLLKAEALYNMYLTPKEFSEKSEQVWSKLLFFLISKHAVK